MKSDITGGKYTVIPTKEVSEFDEVVASLKDRLNDARRALRIIANNTLDPDAGKMAVTAYIATDTSLAGACEELNYLAEKRLSENWENDRDIDMRGIDE